MTCPESPSLFAGKVQVWNPGWEPLNWLGTVSDFGGERAWVLALTFGLRVLTWVGLLSFHSLGFPISNRTSADGFLNLSPDCREGADIPECKLPRPFAKEVASLTEEGAHGPFTAPDSKGWPPQGSSTHRRDTLPPCSAQIYTFEAEGSLHTQREASRDGVFADPAFLSEEPLGYLGTGVGGRANLGARGGVQPGEGNEDRQGAECESQGCACRANAGEACKQRGDPRVCTRGAASGRGAMRSARSGWAGEGRPACAVPGVRVQVRGPGCGAREGGTACGRRARSPAAR